MNIIPPNARLSFYHQSSYNPSFKGFGYYYEPPQEINNLTFYNGIEDTPHRFFSSESLKHALKRPDVLGNEGLKTVGKRIFKDARLMEAEAKVYFDNAKQVQKKFRYDNRKNPGFYKSKIVKYGKTLQDAFSGSYLGFMEGETFGIDYSSNGKIVRFKKYSDDKMQEVSYAEEFNRTGKINHVEFWNSNLPKKIEIGKKNLPGGLKKTDKLYTYDESGKFKYSAMNVYEHSDGRVEMSNFVFPGFSEYDPYNIQRYAIKRTENPNNTVTYQGLMVFRGKQYWCYIPEITFTKERDLKPILRSSLVEFDKQGVKYYSAI